MLSLLLTLALAQTPATDQAAPTPRQAAPSSKAEVKRRRKIRRRTGQEEYKGKIAQDSEFLSDDSPEAKGERQKERRTERRRAKKN